MGDPGGVKGAKGNSKRFWSLKPGCSMVFNGSLMVFKGLQWSSSGVLMLSMLLV